MAKIRTNRVRIVTLSAYALLAALSGIALFELGSAFFGYGSLTSLLVSAPNKAQAYERRYGTMRVRADPGHCREYALDNKTQKVIPSGMVACNLEHYSRFDQRSRAATIRDAFRGQ